ncbi:small ribosomal subunit protein mS23 [Trichomonascus vanleenenianus]|uniref:mitochondrial 37S ribosomal protein mS23 RSM25 n=1 Tax=Trichomonascus vanleenenianus TaxID=2268995 RepID=UPI003ECB53C3
MRLQYTATALLEKTTRLLKAGVPGGSRNPAISEPSWFRVVASHPPTHNLALKTHNLKEFVEKEHTFQVGEKRKATGTYVTRNKQAYSSRLGHLYRPRKIKYFEDKVRRLFYEQHPWELARPKLVVENDGNDISRQDWSSIYQPTKKLDGENVVRRTMYLIESGEFDRDHWLQAYDKARLEFYRLRMREEAEVQVAAEEAVMFGSVFGKSYIQHGIEEEQKVIDKWVEEAKQATAVKKSKMSSSGDEGESS